MRIERRKLSVRIERRKLSVRSETRRLSLRSERRKLSVRIERRMENLASRTLEAQGRRPSLETIRLRSTDICHINISFCIFVHLKQFEKEGLMSQITQAMEKENTADNID